MEDAPLTAEDDDSGKKPSGKKKKSAGALGVFALEPKRDKPAQPQAAEDIWQTLTLTKRQGGKTEAAIPLAQLEAAQTGQTPEASEAEAPLETLSLTEEQFITREIVMAEQTAEAEQSLGHGAAAIAAEAVAFFRNKIVAEGQDPEQAFAETLRSLDAEAQLLAARPEPTRKTSDPTEPLSSDPPAPPTAAAPTRTEEEYVPYYNSGDVMSAALIGGIVGYLIGRRRGRIKTERKLKPTQKKLEKQVKNLQENIAAKEYHIRKVARQRVRDQQRIFQMERETRDKTTETESNRPVALEANQLHGKKIAPERIGHVLVTAGDKRGAEKAKPATKPEKRLAIATDKRIETMSRNELLELSEKVAVENTDLRRVYETHLVGEQGLRRLVSEHMRGGDVQKALREELLEHEIDFERDPILRDRAKASGGAVGSETLNALLRKADAFGQTETKEELAVLKARQAHHESQRHFQQKRRRLLDTSMVAAIAVLFALVIMLLIEGR